MTRFGTFTISSVYLQSYVFRVVRTCHLSVQTVRVTYLYMPLVCTCHLSVCAPFPYVSRTCHLFMCHFSVCVTCQSVVRICDTCLLNMFNTSWLSRCITCIICQMARDEFVTFDLVSWLTVRLLWTRHKPAKCTCTVAHWFNLALDQSDTAWGCGWISVSLFWRVQSLHAFFLTA